MSKQAYLFYSTPGAQTFGYVFTLIALALGAVLVGQPHRLLHVAALFFVFCAGVMFGITLLGSLCERIFIVDKEPSL